MLFIISGASGVGKSTLCGQLLDEFESLTLSVSYTTRAPRGDEQHGIHYHFVDMPTFEAMIGRSEFAEHALVHGNRYGTSRATIDEALAVGKSVLFDVDYQGAELLRQSYPDEAVSVMVFPPSMQILEERLRGRGTDSDEVVAKRMAKAHAEMSHFRRFGYAIVNDELGPAYDRIRGIFLAERCRTRRMQRRLEELLR